MHAVFFSTISSPEHSMANIKRPFAPRSAFDISIGDIVKFQRQGGKVSKGQVKYVGQLPGKSDMYLGVELERECKCSIHGRYSFTAD